MFTFDLSGLQAKMKSLLAIRFYMDNFHKDAAAFLQQKLRQEVLNFPRQGTPKKGIRKAKSTVQTTGARQTSVTGRDAGSASGFGASLGRDKGRSRRGTRSARNSRGMFHQQEPPLGNAYIGRISGMLARSISLQLNHDSTTIWVNTSIAPYAEKVAEYSKKRFGFNYFEIVLNLYGDFVRKKIQEGFSEVMYAINNRTPYTYVNKFSA